MDIISLDDDESDIEEETFPLSILKEKNKREIEGEKQFNMVIASLYYSDSLMGMNFSGLLIIMKWKLWKFLRCRECNTIPHIFTRSSVLCAPCYLDYFVCKGCNGRVIERHERHPQWASYLQECKVCGNGHVGCYFVFSTRISVRTGQIIRTETKMGRYKCCNEECNVNKAIEEEFSANIRNKKSTLYSQYVPMM